MMDVGYGFNRINTDIVLRVPMYALGWQAPFAIFKNPEESLSSKIALSLLAPIID